MLTRIVATIVALASCAPRVQLRDAASELGADHRAAFQVSLTSGLLDLRGAPGRYEVFMPPAGARPYASLTMPDGAQIIGDDLKTTTIAFVGDPDGRDWCAVRSGNNWLISGVTLEVAEPGGVWGEQSHVICVRGPRVGGELHHAAISHPVVAGSSRGDCMQIIGYPPDAATGAVDQRVWDQHVHHVTFRHCARSGVAVHSGLHGRMLPPDINGEVHSSTRFDHNIFEDISDQDLDEEGTGDIGGIDSSDVVEWDHNTHRLGASAQSALAISIYPGSTHLHHNAVVGRGVAIMGGSHDVHDNTVTQTVPNGGDPVVYLRKAGSSRFRNETWVRMATAGPGAVFGAAQKISAPTNVRLDNVKLVQHTAAVSIFASGIAGFALRAVSVTDDGSPSVRDAIMVEGTNGSTGVRTTGILVQDSKFAGSFGAALSVSGSYTGGAGSVEMRGSQAPGSQLGLRCDNVLPVPTPHEGPLSGGVIGPITYASNDRPMSCVVP